MSATSTPHQSRSLVGIIVPIILMVLSLGGIAATVIISNHNGSAPTVASRSNLPSGNMTNGTLPSGVPTDIPTAGQARTVPNGQTGQNNQWVIQGRGGLGIPSRGGVTGFGIVVLGGCAAVFGGSAVFLAMTLAGRRRNNPAPVPAAPVAGAWVNPAPPAPYAEPAPTPYTQPGATNPPVQPVPPVQPTTPSTAPTPPPAPAGDDAPII
ncbi:MAG: hypothetical protein LBI33_03120 [Propionibacteriaceae bacterium]|jgi:hypothetical protein|nr:hypothetical protein [Propionibacteriaceae bacterium]